MKVSPRPGRVVHGTGDISEVVGVEKRRRNVRVVGPTRGWRPVGSSRVGCPTALGERVPRRGRRACVAALRGGLRLALSLSAVRADRGAPRAAKKRPRAPSTSGKVLAVERAEAAICGHPRWRAADGTGRGREGRGESGPACRAVRAETMAAAWPSTELRGLALEADGAAVAVTGLSVRVAGF